MAELLADLHLHSVLSPCAERTMTPRALVQSALHAGLAVIALTDHHAAGNAEAILAAAEESGLWAIPGMEVQTREEVHLLCYFPDLPSLIAWEQAVWRDLPDRPNDERFFGPQEVCSVDGRVTGRCERLLLTSVCRSVEQVYQAVTERGGICLPAHVDRPGFGLLPQLGLVPPVFPPERPLEISPRGKADDVLRLFALPPRTRFFSSSDAHRLHEIGCRPALLRVEGASWEEFALAISGSHGRWLGIDGTAPSFQK